MVFLMFKYSYNTINLTLIFDLNIIANLIKSLVDDLIYKVIKVSTF